MSVIETVTCATDCDTNLPVVSFSNCSPQTATAQIVKIYMSKEGFTDITSASEWNDRLPGNESDQNEAADNAIRVFTVIGDKPAPEKSEKEISGGRFVTPQKTHTVNFSIDEISQANYDAAREFECGGNRLIWYEDSAGFVFGGNAGISASINIDHIITASREDFQTLTGTAKWKSQFSPRRDAKPF